MLAHESYHDSAMDRATEVVTTVRFDLSPSWVAVSVGIDGMWDVLAPFHGSALLKYSRAFARFLVALRVL